MHCSILTKTSSDEKRLHPNLVRMSWQERYLHSCVTVMQEIEVEREKKRRGHPTAQSFGCMLASLVAGRLVKIFREISQQEVKLNLFISCNTILAFIFFH